jgi:hypothetical protein
MKLILQFSPTSYHFIPLRSKYSPQHYTHNNFLILVEKTFGDNPLVFYKDNMMHLSFQPPLLTEAFFSSASFNTTSVLNVKFLSATVVHIHSIGLNCGTVRCGLQD